MPAAALVLWCCTAAAGGYLLTGWLRHGGLRRQPIQVTVFPALLTLAHPVLAITGLALWAAFLRTHRAGFAWGAFAGLCAAAMLGFVLLTAWLSGRGGRHARAPSKYRPYRAVIWHVVAGMATFVLVLVATTRAGR